MMNSQVDDLAFFYINEDFKCSSVTPAEHDRLLAHGWRHFGQHFFRYNLELYNGEIQLVIPLRIRLSDHRLSASQERVLRKNSDVEVSVGPVNVSAEVIDLFSRHKRRFKAHIPKSIYTFLAKPPDDEPCETRQLSVRLGDRLLAAGFFDIGDRSVSAIYTTFDPDETHRGLGIFTILKELEFAAAKGKELYYLGYSYNGHSFYDYKKRFHGTEAFDWNAAWLPVPREV